MNAKQIKLNPTSSVAPISIHYLLVKLFCSTYKKTPSCVIFPSLKEHPNLKLKDKYCSYESFCHDSNNFKIAEMYSSNNGKMGLMQDKMAVLVSVILIAACNFHVLVTFLRSAKITREHFPIREKISHFTAHILYTQYTSALRTMRTFPSVVFDAINITLDHLALEQIA